MRQITALKGEKKGKLHEKSIKVSKNGEEKYKREKSKKVHQKIWWKAQKEDKKDEIY